MLVPAMAKCKDVFSLLYKTNLTPEELWKPLEKLAKENHTSLARYLLVILWYALRGYDVSKIVFYQDEDGKTHYQFSGDGRSGFEFVDTDGKIDSYAKAIKKIAKAQRLRGRKIEQ